MDLTELLALLEAIDQLTDEQLAEALDALRQAANDRLDGDMDDDALAELRDIAEATERITAEQALREDAAEERRAEADALRARINGDSDDDDEGGDGGADETATDDAPDGATADGDVEVEADAEPEPVEAADEPVPVAASTPPPVRRPRVGRVAARRPAEVRPAPTAAAPSIPITASANLPGIDAGSPLDTPDAIARAFESAVTASLNYRGPRVAVPIMRVGHADPRAAYGDDRTLGRDEIANRRRIEAVTSPDAILASGGVCAPSVVRYDFPGAGVTDRPVSNDALVRFGADRGGVRLFPRIALSDVESGVDDWTNANDESPADPTTKPCVTVTCPSATETIVEAVTRCLEVGNFRARFFPEQVAEWGRMLEVQHARFAENRRMADIAAGSTANTAGQVLGAATDILTTLDRAIAGAQSRNRDPRLRYRWVAPRWVQQLMLTDIARQAEGTADERYAKAEADLAAYFRVRGVNVTWHLDGEAGQVFPALVAGTLRGWPSTITTWLYPEGSWLFLDGGSLDLGIVRDSTLNSTNDFQMFAETFEESAFFGIESQQLTMDVCPDGSLSALVDIDPCSSGS